MTTYQNTEGVLIASADCNTMSRGAGTGAALCNYYSLPYYPYLVYGDPSSVKEYEGARDYASLLAFAEQNLGPVTPPSPVPAPMPHPKPTPSPVPTPVPTGSCPDDAEVKTLQSGFECLWQSGSGFTMPPEAVEYCDYLSSGYLGYYWDHSRGDYDCAASARKTMSGSSSYCLWQDGVNGFHVPSGAVADCNNLANGMIGLVVPGVELV